MGLIECASFMSIYRGYDYFAAHKVQTVAPLTQTQYRAAVMGTAAAPYDVLIDIAHPRSSKCSCPHADGRRIVCKHMIATYFTVFPDEARHIYAALLADDVNDAEDAWDEYGDEDDEDEENNKVIECVCTMKKSELQQALLQVLFDGPEWQYARFMEEHDIGDE